MSYKRRRQNAPKVAPPPEPIHISFDASPTISAFLQSAAFIRGIKGPVGSGKSSACVVEGLRRGLEMPHNYRQKRLSKGVVVRNTYRQLLDTTVATWLEWFPEAQFGPFLRQDMVHPITVGDLHLEVLFRALDRPEDVAKLKSLDATWGWVNEASEVQMSAVDMLESRLGRFPKKITVKAPFWHGLIMDTNPPPEDHWWFWLAEEVTPILLAAKAREYATPFQALESLRHLFSVKSKEPGDFIREWQGLVRAVDGMLIRAGKNAGKAKESFDRLVNKYEFFSQPSGLAENAENIANLPDGYYERQMIGKTQDWIDVYVHGKYGIVMDGQVAYPEYMDEFHFNPDLTDAIDGIPILRGWDFGRTPCAIFTQVDPEGRWLSFDELTSRDTDIDEFGDIVNKHTAAQYPGFTFIDYCDPSGFFKGDKSDLTCAQILAAKGIHVEGGIQDPTIRFNSVKRALRGFTRGKAEFQVGPKCKALRRGFQGAYCYRKMNVSGEERYAEEVVKKHPISDIHNALQYIGTMLYRDELTSSYTQKDREEEYGFQSGFVSQQAGASAVTGY